MMLTVAQLSSVWCPVVVGGGGVIMTQAIHLGFSYSCTLLLCMMLLSHIVNRVSMIKTCSAFSGAKLTVLESLMSVSLYEIKPQNRDLT